MAQNKSLLTYTNPIYGLQIQYPSDWEAVDNLGNGTETNNILRFFPKYLNNTDIFIDFFVDSIDPNLKSIVDYMSKYIDQNLNFFRGFNFKLIYSSTDNVSLSGHPAYQIIFTYSPENSGIAKGKEIGTVIGNLVYRVIYAGGIGQYTTYSEMANKMLDSLQIDPTK
jgi:hypothetical protein